MKSFEENELTWSIRESYDRVTDEYTSHVCDELNDKPFDRELLRKFALKLGRDEICDVGCAQVMFLGI